MNAEIENILLKNRSLFHPLVDFDSGKEKLLQFDFSASNTELTTADISDTQRFSQYIERKLESRQAKFGIGGYNEDRVLYKRSSLFEPAGLASAYPGESWQEATVSARSVHLGIDIWGPVGTPVYVPVGGMVHSFAFNDQFGDYGATIILKHQLDTIVFHTLYGHVSLLDLAQLQEGKYVSRGEVIAHFGKPAENGWWPPHLHFQVIGDMELREGDYPGVCTPGERRKYLHNCPDPDLVANLMKLAMK